MEQYDRKAIKKGLAKLWAVTATTLMFIFCVYAIITHEWESSIVVGFICIGLLGLVFWSVSWTDFAHVYKRDDNLPKN